MLILAIILFGMLVGAAAQLILGNRSQNINWTHRHRRRTARLVRRRLLIASLLSGDGLELRPSGIIGSIVGAVLLTLGWDYWQGRQRTARLSPQSSGRSGLSTNSVNWR